MIINFHWTSIGFVKRIIQIKIFVKNLHIIRNGYFSSSSDVIVLSSADIFGPFLKICLFGLFRRRVVCVVIKDGLVYLNPFVLIASFRFAATQPTAIREDGDSQLTRLYFHINCINLIIFKRDCFALRFHLSNPFDFVNSLKITNGYIIDKTVFITSSYV